MIHRPDPHTIVLKMHDSEGYAARYAPRLTLWVAANVALKLDARGDLTEIQVDDAFDEDGNHREDLEGFAAAAEALDGATDSMTDLSELMGQRPEDYWTEQTVMGFARWCAGEKGATAPLALVKEYIKGPGRSPDAGKEPDTDG